MREQPFLDPGDEHHREFEPLGGVQRHHLYAFLAFGGFMITGIQRGFGEEGLQRLGPFAGGFRVHALALTEGTTGVDQLGKVLETRLALLALLGGVVLAQAGDVDDVLDQLMQRHAGGVVVEAIDDVGEGTHGGGGAPLEGAVGNRIAHRLPHGQVAVARTLAQLLDGAHADATRRHVDHALQGGIVLAVVHQTQVGERVLDLETLIETLAAIDAIRHALADQRLLQHA